MSIGKTQLLLSFQLFFQMDDHDGERLLLSLKACVNSNVSSSQNTHLIFLREKSNNIYIEGTTTIVQNSESIYLYVLSSSTRKWDFCGHFPLKYSKSSAFLAHSLCLSLSSLLNCHAFAKDQLGQAFSCGISGKNWKKWKKGRGQKKREFLGGKTSKQIARKGNNLVVKREIRKTKVCMSHTSLALLLLHSQENWKLLAKPSNATHIIQPTGW